MYAILSFVQIPSTSLDYYSNLYAVITPVLCFLIKQYFKLHTMVKESRL